MYVAAIAQKKGEVSLKAKPSTPGYDKVPLKSETNENYHPVEDAGSRIRGLGKRSEY